jgi:HK97 family phage prohead protease
MKVEIRNNSVFIEGYVNAVARDSKPIPSIGGRFIEQVVPGVFQRALDKSTNVDLLLNHDKSRKLGSTIEGNLELFEDNIGLKAICTVSDNEVVRKAKDNKLKGWSFGFYISKDRWEDGTNGMKRRYLEDIELTEVSIIDDTNDPAYIATSIEVRNDKEILIENRVTDSKIITVYKSEKEESRAETDLGSILEIELEYIRARMPKRFT